MGRERTGAGQHFHVCTACLIFLALFSGCSDLIQARQHLRYSEQYAAAGDFQNALLESEKALELRGGAPLADRAFFNIALIYVNQDNPNRDPQRALEYFDRLEAQYPDSPYTRMARIGRPLVEQNERLMREVARRRVMLKRAWDDNREMNELLEKHNLAIARSEKEKRRLSEELEKLNQMILESKKVDIEIEEKKRQTTQ